jgi:hypothetical protein
VTSRLGNRLLECDPLARRAPSGFPTSRWEASPRSLSRRAYAGEGVGLVTEIEDTESLVRGSKGAASALGARSAGLTED